MWQVLYPLALRVAKPLVRLRLKRRARSEPAYGERVEERFGAVPDDVEPGSVWFHTVSAGETIAAAPVIRKLAEQFDTLPFLVTTMTPTGSEQVRERLGDVVAHCYAPYDFTAGVRRFFDRVRPRLLVLMETELWPNLIRFAHERNVPVLVVNARLSEKSARGYSRIGSLTRRMLTQVRHVACQTRAHRDRFIALGAPAPRVEVIGSVKFDVSLPDDFDERVQAIAEQARAVQRPVWIAGSTHPGEDEIVLDAHRAVLETIPEVLLLLVPRHPVRGDDVLTLAAERGFVAAKLWDDDAPDDCSVRVCDTMGELQYLYGVSDVALLAGSFVPVGGHNPIEAAVCQQPLLSGPITHNFTEIMAQFAEAGCLRTVTDAESLASAVTLLFEDRDAAIHQGEQAAAVVARNRGATDRLVALLHAQICDVSADMSVQEEA